MTSSTGAEKEAERPTLTDAMRNAYYDLIPIAPGTETWAMAGIPDADKVWEAMTAAWQASQSALSLSERAETLAVLEPFIRAHLRGEGVMASDIQNAAAIAARLRSAPALSPSEQELENRHFTREETDILLKAMAAHHGRQP